MQHWKINEFIKLNESIHGITVVIPTNDRDIPGSIPGRYNLQIKITSDIDFKNAFNAMSQAALWQVKRMFKIPDVDLLEHIYEAATVRLAPNDEDSATITFNTGVAQGSIMSPQLFNISSMPCYACSRLQNRMRILVTGCRSARIRKETTSEMKTVINSTT